MIHLSDIRKYEKCEALLWQTSMTRSRISLFCILRSP